MTTEEVIQNQEIKHKEFYALMKKDIVPIAEMILQEKDKGHSPYFKQMKKFEGKVLRLKPFRHLWEEDELNTHRRKYMLYFTSQVKGNSSNIYPEYIEKIITEDDYPEYFI